MDEAALRAAVLALRRHLLADVLGVINRLPEERERAVHEGRDDWARGHKWARMQMGLAVRRMMGEAE